jgi:hypothetical protein
VIAMNVRTLADMRYRVVAANEGADEAIVAYEARKDQLRRENPGHQYQIAKRDDHLLAELGSRAEFRQARATRLAVTLVAELLAHSILDGAA